MSRTGVHLITTPITGIPLVEMSVTSPTNNQTLVYNTTNNRFENATVPSNGGVPTGATIIADTNLAGTSYTITVTTMTPATVVSLTPVVNTTYLLNAYITALLSAGGSVTMAPVLFTISGSGIGFYSNNIITSSDYVSPINLNSSVIGSASYYIDSKGTKDVYITFTSVTSLVIGLRYCGIVGTMPRTLTVTKGNVSVMQLA